VTDGGLGRVRAFLALDLDPSALERLRALIESLRGTLPGVRWARPEGLHLTLRFLGATEEERARRVLERVEPAAAAAPASILPLGPLGLFPGRGAPRVLWVGLALPSPLRALQQACEEAARAEGFPPEERAFSPHLTLGRWSERARRPALPPVELGPAHLERLVLYRSRPQAGGSVYTPLRGLPLGGLG
jgi:RNA 2',3'-cyclic 3'-phosphodiesterase